MRKYEIKDIEAYRNRKPRGKGKKPESEKQVYIRKTVNIPQKEFDEIIKAVDESGKSFSKFCLDFLREYVKNQ